MRAKQIVAVAVLLLIAFLLVFPPLATGSVRVSLSPSSTLSVEHLYVTVTEISAHRADATAGSGWSEVTNRSSQVDLTMVDSAETVALGSLSLGQYDTIRLRVTSATAIVNGTSREIQLMSTVFTIPASFFIGFGAQTTVMLRVAADMQDSSGVLNLELAFTSAANPTP